MISMHAFTRAPTMLILCSDQLTAISVETN